MNIIAIIILALSGSLLSNIDKESGMIIGENWELVKANCTGCHAAPLITSQKNDRESWIEIIRWMQNKQGLWQFDVSTESKILDYLSKNYSRTNK